MLAAKQCMTYTAGLRMLPAADVAGGDHHPAFERVQEAQPEELGVAIVAGIQCVPLFSPFPFHVKMVATARYESILSMNVHLNTKAWKLILASPFLVLPT